MPYSISQMVVDGNQNVIALDWKYSNPDGSLGNQHKLLEPYGSTKLAAVTEEVAVGWLEEQLQNTTEQFEAAIAKRKAADDYAQTLVPYTNTGTGTFQVAGPVAEEPEVAVMPASKKKKK